MRGAIDAVGLRNELGLNGPANLELIATDGRLELTVVDVPAHVEEQDGLPVIVSDEPIAPMSIAETRAAIERVSACAVARSTMR